MMTMADDTLTATCTIQKMSGIAPVSGTVRFSQQVSVVVLVFANSNQLQHKGSFQPMFLFRERSTPLSYSLIVIIFPSCPVTHFPRSQSVIKFLSCASWMKKYAGLSSPSNIKNA